MVRYPDNILLTCCTIILGFASFCMIVLTFGAIFLASVFIYVLVSHCGLLAFVVVKLIFATISFAFLVFWAQRNKGISTEKEFWRRAFMVFLITASLMGISFVAVDALQRFQMQPLD